MRPVLIVWLAGMLSGSLSAPLPATGADPPESYRLEVGRSFIYDVEVETQDNDRAITWTGSPVYTTTSVAGETVTLQVETSFSGELRSKGDNAARPRGAPAPPFGPGVSTMRSSTSTTVRMSAQGQLFDGGRGPELPPPLGPMHAIPIVALPKEPAAKWETTRETQLGLAMTLFRPEENLPGAMRPQFGPFAPTRSGLTFDQRLELDETVTYEAEAGIVLRACRLVSREQVNGKPALEFETTGAVTFADDGSLPAKVEWSGSYTLRTGVGEVTSPVKVSARRLTDEEIAERAQAVELARLEAAAKFREDLPQLIADLKSGDERLARNAARRIESGDPGEGDAAVAAALHEAWKAADHPARDQIARPLVKWATAEQAELLIELLKERDHTVQRGAIDRLAALRIEKAIPTIAPLLAEPFVRGSARAALERFGAAAEPYAITLLEHGDGSVRREVIELLKAIGTARSLGPLQKATLDKSPTIKGSAEAAVKAIQQRISQPIT